MSENLQFPNEFFPALEYLAQAGPVFACDVESTGIPYSHFLWLKDNGYAKMVTPDPNFLYQLPEDRWSAYQFKLKTEGYTAYYLLKEAHDEHAKQEAKDRAQRIQDIQDTKKEFRHNYFVAILSELISTGLAHLPAKFIDFLKTLFISLVNH